MEALCKPSLFEFRFLSICKSCFGSSDHTVGRNEFKGNKDHFSVATQSFVLHISFRLQAEVNHYDTSFFLDAIG